MPDLSLEEFQAQLGVDAQPPEPTNQEPVSLLPVTDEAVKSASQSSQVAELARPRAVEPSPYATPDFATKMGARPGVPFDTTSGVPFFKRMRMNVQPTDEDVLKMLKDSYGAENVRTNSFGWPIVTMRDEFGKQKDVLANPTNIDWEDTLGLLTNIPEIAGSLGALYATKGRTLAPGVMNALKTLMLAAGGSALGGAYKDVAVRSMEGEPIQPAEIAGRRGSMALMDTTLGGGLGVGGKIGATVISPFSKWGPLQQQARQAQSYIAGKYGVHLPMTPAEATGSPILSKTEAMEMQKPGSSTAFQRFIADRWKQIQELQNIILGGGVPDEELAGQEFLKTAGAKLAPAEFAVERAALETTDAAKNELLKGAGPEYLRSAAIRTPDGRILEGNIHAMAAAKMTGEHGDIPWENYGYTTSRGRFISKQEAERLGLTRAPLTRVDKTAVGQRLRKTANELRAEFKMQDNANYDAFYSHPLANENIVDADVVAKPIRDLMKQFPTVEETVEEATGVLLPSGKEATREITRERVLRRNIPSGINARLSELASTEGGKISIASLKEVRTDIANAIAVGEAVPGVKQGYLKAAEKALTKAIDAGLEQIDDAELTQLWKNATSFHRANVGKFERTGIAEMFRDPSQGSYLGDTELVSRVSEGKKAQDVYAAYRDFYGPTSPEMEGIRQSIRDDTLARSELSETIDAKGFIRRLEQLDTDAPEVLRDVFGESAKGLRSSAKALVAAQGETLPKEELEALVKSGNLSATKLRDLMIAQSKRDELYRNDLFKTISAGNVSAEKIKPHEVVNRVVFHEKTQPQQLSELMALVSDRPEVTEDLRRLTFKRVLDDATVTTASGERVIGANKLEQTLSNENTVKKLRTVLGSSTFDDLVQLKNFLKPGAIQESSSKSAGGLVGGSQISGLVERGELSYGARAFKNFILATVYTSPTLRNYFANTVLSAQDKALIVGAAAASAPMLSAITRTFGKEGARQVAEELSRAGSVVSQGPTPGTGDIPWDDFLNRLEQK